jgi:hypothetical protein
MRKIRYRMLFVPAILFVSGCICPYWANPSLNCVWPVPVGDSVDSIRAFRVDTRETCVLPDSGMHPTHRLHEIALDSSGGVPTQVQFSCTRGFLAFFVALNYTTWHQETVSVCLYRPGFATIHHPAWTLASQVQWVPATTLAEQCRAIDDLVKGNLEPGGTSPEHRSALLFAVSEYRRLAALLPRENGAANRAEIEKKAEDLEKRAGEPSRDWLLRLID